MALELRAASERGEGQGGFPVPDFPGFTTTALALTANLAYFGRFYVSRPISAVSISFILTVAAGADDNVDVGLYNTSLARLGSAGATAGKLTGAAGVRNVVLSTPVALSPGTYIAGFSVGTFGGTAASVAGTSVATSTNIVDLFGTTVGVRRIFYQAATAHPLANPAIVTGATGGIPLMAVKET